MKTLGKIIALVAFVAAPVSAGYAQSGEPQAKSLDEVMSLVRQGTSRERTEENRRIAEFQRERGQQQQRLRDARAEQARLQRRSKQLEDQFDANERQITQLEGQLRERQGNLAELFGVVKQSSEDLRGFISQSLVSVELPGREEFLNDQLLNASLELLKPVRNDTRAIEQGHLFK